MRNFYSEGYQAFIDGKSFTEVPLTIVDGSFLDWQEGWLDARNEQADDFFKDED